MPSDEEWIAEVLRRNEQPLLRYVRRRVGDLEIARELVQEAFVRLANGESKIRDPLGQRKWLFKVCRNLVIDHLRKKSPVKNLENSVLDTLESGDPQPADYAELLEQNSRVWAFVDALPDRTQVIMHLKFDHGFSYQEISASTDVSVSNVGFILSTTIRNIRAQFSMGGEDEHEA